MSISREKLKSTIFNVIQIFKDCFLVNCNGLILFFLLYICNIFVLINTDTDVSYIYYLYLFINV